MSAEGRTSDPSLSDFHNDMNEHGGAEYKKIGAAWVAELDTYPSGWRLLLWKAVETGDGYAPPDGKPGNRYAWDAKGSRGFEDYDDARAEFVRLGRSVEKVRAFCEEHPYDGPRSSYAERYPERVGDK